MLPPPLDREKRKTAADTVGGRAESKQEENSATTILFSYLSFFPQYLLKLRNS